MLIVVCHCCVLFIFLFFFFKQKTAYEMRISDWSSDVCSSDLIDVRKDVSGWITRLNDAMIDNYTASGAWRNESIADIAARLVIEKPDMLAFIEGDRSLYLGNLVTKARKIAAVLAKIGRAHV